MSKMISKLAVLVLVLSQGLMAIEDYERYAPQGASGTRIRELDAEASVVVIDKLCGLRIVGKPFMLVPGGLKDMEGVQIFSPKVLVDNALREKLRPFLGKPLSGGELADLKNMIRDFAASKGTKLFIYVPRQDLSGKAVQILASETPMRKRLRPRQMEEKKEPRRVETYVGYKDNGSDATKDERVFVGFAVKDFLVPDSTIDYQFTASPGSDHLRSHTANWEKTLANDDLLQIYGGYIRTRPDSEAQFFDEDRIGKSYRLSLRYEKMLDAEWRAPDESVVIFGQRLTLGADYKHAVNDVTQTFVGGFVNKNLVRTDVNQLVFGYTANVKDPWGANMLRARLYVAPFSSLTAEHKDHAYVEATGIDSAEATYEYLRLNAVRRTPLVKGFKLYTKMQYQYTKDSLLGSEQMGVGGSSTVRGYEEDEANGDRGWMISNEIRTPYITLRNLCDDAEFRDQLQFLVFWDYAVVRDNRLPAFSNDSHKTYLSSAGCGFRYNINSMFMLKFDYGWQLRDSKVTDDDRFNHRGHLSLICRY